MGDEGDPRGIGACLDLTGPETVSYSHEGEEERERGRERAEFEGLPDSAHLERGFE